MITTQQLLPFCEQPHVLFSDPDKFEKRHQNLFYLNQPLFESDKVFEQVLELTRKAKDKDIIPTERIWLGIYFEEEILQGSHPKVSIRYIDEEVGFGVFAEQNIAPCSFVGEYTGRLIPWKKKLLREKFHAIRYTVWGMEQKKFILDGETMGNFTRFINHSPDPNICLRSVYCQGIPRMIFLALKEIKPGVQLTFDYGSLFWKEHPFLPKVLF